MLVRTQAVWWPTASMVPGCAAAPCLCGRRPCGGPLLAWCLGVPLPHACADAGCVVAHFLRGAWVCRCFMRVRTQVVWWSSASMVPGSAAAPCVFRLLQLPHVYVEAGCVVAQC